LAIRDIVGHDRPLEILKGSILKNRISHAYLFRGEDGIGKKLVAMNFSKMLNCQNNRSASRGVESRSPTEPYHTSPAAHDKIDCCDTCPSCIKINKATHPDVFSIAPEEGQIKVGVIRNLEESLSYKAYEGKWKIAVIDNAESLNQSAANAFLKTLEEPPEQSIIILISSIPDLIPSTIRSRCHAIHFSPLPVKEMEKLLEHYTAASKESQQYSRQALLLSLLSGGRPGWALSSDLVDTRDRTFGEFQELLSVIDEDVWPDRESMEEWYDWVQLWLRDIAVFKATSKKDLLINQDKAKQIHDIARKANLPDILKLSSTLYNIKGFLRFNLNKQITLFNTYLLLKSTFRGDNA
jgi:DNA polymerase-3 subunit delta'